MPYRDVDSIDTALARLSKVPSLLSEEKLVANPSLLVALYGQETLASAQLATTRARQTVERLHEIAKTRSTRANCVFAQTLLVTEPWMDKKDVTDRVGELRDRESLSLHYYYKMLKPLRWEVAQALADATNQLEELHDRNDTADTYKHIYGDPQRRELALELYSEILSLLRHFCHYEWLGELTSNLAGDARDVRIVGRVLFKNADLDLDMFQTLTRVSQLSAALSRRRAGARFSGTITSAVSGLFYSVSRTVDDWSDWEEYIPQLFEHIGPVHQRDRRRVIETNPHLTKVFDSSVRQAIGPDISDRLFRTRARLNEWKSGTRPSSACLKLAQDLWRLLQLRETNEPEPAIPTLRQLSLVIYHSVYRAWKILSEEDRRTLISAIENVWPEFAEEIRSLWYGKGGMPIYT